MTVIIAITTTLAILSLAVIFGTDMSIAVVQRAFYGDRRFPPIGIGGTVLTVATVVLASVWASPVAGILSGVALALLIVWLLLFALIAKPINTTLTAAALADEVPTNARALQNRWESIIVLRATLLAVDIALLCATLFFI